MEIARCDVSISAGRVQKTPASYETARRGNARFEEQKDREDAFDFVERIT